MKRAKEPPKPCKYCSEPCDSKAEIIGMQLSTGECWHVRCAPSSDKNESR